MLTNCYTYATNMTWYYLFLIYGLYMACLAPSLLHIIHFLTAMQAQLKESSIIVLLGTNLRCLLSALVLLGPLLLVLTTLLVPKGVVFYFVLSAATLLQFVHSIRSKKYTFVRVLFYDILLTVVLTLLSLFLPSLNFQLLTWKQVVVFWNYFLGVCLFGVLLSIKLIKMEMVEDRQLGDQSDFVKAETGGESDRRE